MSSRFKCMPWFSIILFDCTDLFRMHNIGSRVYHYLLLLCIIGRCSYCLHTCYGIRKNSNSIRLAYVLCIIVYKYSSMGCISVHHHHLLCYAIGYISKSYDLKEEMCLCWSLFTKMFKRAFTSVTLYIPTHNIQRWYVLSYIIM